MYTHTHTDINRYRETGISVYPDLERYRSVYLPTYLLIYFKDLVHMIVGSGNLRYVGQASSLEIQERADVTILNLKSIG